LAPSSGACADEVLVDVIQVKRLSAKLGCMVCLASFIMDAAADDDVADVVAANAEDAEAAAVTAEGLAAATLSNVRRAVVEELLAPPVELFTLLREMALVPEAVGGPDVADADVGC
jgi:hypothetical protein